MLQLGPWFDSFVFLQVFGAYTSCTLPGIMILEVDVLTTIG